MSPRKRRRIEGLSAILGLVTLLLGLFVSDRVSLALGVIMVYGSLGAMLLVPFLIDLRDSNKGF